MSANPHESLPPQNSGGAVRWTPPTPEHLQSLLPNYEVIGMLGQGGMGAVYKARQLSLDRLVAIKILPPEMDAEVDANFMERFKNEARTLAKMSHPGIVHVHDFGQTEEGQLYFVMEFIDGTDVAGMVRAQGRLAPEHALAITAHVCDALHYAHARGVIHRDIKPANVLINTEGQVKVADFGLAKAKDSAPATALTRTNMTMGTPDFMAPESFIMDVETDHRADLYAVGVMLYNMLTGEIPRGRFKPASDRAGSDPRFDVIINKAMESERTDRYQTALNLRRDLDVILTVPQDKVEAPPPEVVRTGPVRTRAASLPSPPPPKKKSSAAPVVVILALLGVAGFFGWKQFSKPPPAPDAPTALAETNQPASPASAPAVPAPQPETAAVKAVPPASANAEPPPQPAAAEVKAPDAGSGSVAQVPADKPAPHEPDNPISPPGQELSVDGAWTSLLPAAQLPRDLSESPQKDGDVSQPVAAWALEDGVLHANPSGRFAVVSAAWSLPESYDLSMRVKGLSVDEPSSSICVVLPVGARHLIAHLALHNFENAGLELINDKAAVQGPCFVHPALLRRNVEQLVEFSVRSQDGAVTVTVGVGGRPVMAWSGPEDSITKHWRWTRMKPGYLGLGANFASVSFREVRARRAGLPPPAVVIAPPAVTAPPAIVAAPVVTAAPPAAPEKWTDWLAAQVRAGEIPHGLAAEGGGFKVVAQKVLIPLGPVMKDGAIRVTATRNATRELHVMLRCVNPDPDYIRKPGFHQYVKTYRLQSDNGGIHPTYREASGTAPVAMGPTLVVAADVSSSHVMELRLVGDVLTATCDGGKPFTTQDTRIAEGQPALYAEAGALIEKIEVLNLDPKSIPATLLGQYVAALRRARDAAPAAEKAAYETELARLKSDATLPAEDAPGTPDAMLTLRQIARQQLGK